MLKKQTDWATESLNDSFRIQASKTTYVVMRKVQRLSRCGEYRTASWKCATTQVVEDIVCSCMKVQAGVIAHRLMRELSSDSSGISGQ